MNQSHIPRPHGGNNPPLAGPTNKLHDSLDQTPHSKVSFDELRLNVKQGEALFRQLLSASGFDGDQTVSRVHGYEDEYRQAELLCLLDPSPELQRVTSCLTFGSHRFDDLVDPPEHVANRKLFSQHRRDFAAFRRIDNPLCRFANALCELSLHPEGIEKALSRIGYSALIMHADRSQQRQLIGEYQMVGVAGIDESVAEEILSIDPLWYSFTSKGIQELAESVRASFNFTHAELLTLMYTPALLMHDYEEEIDKGELPPITMDANSMSILKSMLQIPMRWIARYETAPDLRLQQLELVLHSFHSVLPPELLTSYRDLEIILRDIKS